MVPIIQKNDLILMSGLKSRTMITQVRRQILISVNRIACFIHTTCNSISLDYSTYTSFTPRNSMIWQLSCIKLYTGHRPDMNFWCIFGTQQVSFARYRCTHVLQLFHFASQVSKVLQALGFGNLFRRGHCQCQLLSFIPILQVTDSVHKM